MKAEVDEYGVMIITHRRDTWWVEVTVRFFASGSCLTRVDAENAPGIEVAAAGRAAAMLLEWCTKGGTAEWLSNESKATKCSNAGSEITG